MNLSVILGGVVVALGIIAIVWFFIADARRQARAKTRTRVARAIQGEVYQERETNPSPMELYQGERLDREQLKEITSMLMDAFKTLLSLTTLVGGGTVSLVFMNPRPKAFEQFFVAGLLFTLFFLVASFLVLDQWMGYYKDYKKSKPISK